MLTLGWSDGHTFMPVDFSLLSSKTSSINGINQEIDKRCLGYKRRIEATQSAPDQIPAMIERALSKGIEASYLLMDTWFTQQPLIKAIVEQELDWAVALQQLIELLQDVLKKTNKQTQQLLKNQLSQWIAGLPSYIRAYLPNLACES